MTPDNIDTEALRELVRIASTIEDPPSAAQLRAIRALADAAPVLLAKVEAQRKEIERLSDSDQKVRSAVGLLCKTPEEDYGCGCLMFTTLEGVLRLRSERDALKAEVERLRAALRDLLRVARNYDIENCHLAEAEAALRGEEASRG